MLRKSKSITQIFEETKHYDLVITNDAPLATALNRLVEAPRLDYFAMTPRQIASRFGLLHFSKMYSKAEIILNITNQTGKPLKLIHQSIDKIFDVWNNTGLLDSCNLYLGEENKLLVYLEKYPSVELAMERFDEDYYGEKKIAVLGGHLFNELDKQVLPKKGKNPEAITLLQNEDLELDKTYLFNSASDLLNQTLDLITPDNADEIAIVLNTESDYLDILKSRLNAKGTDLQIKSFLSENIQTREILAFMESSLSLSDLKLKDVLFLEKLFDISLYRRFNQYYFSNYVSMFPNYSALQRIYEIMGETRTFTFKKFFETMSKSFQLKPKDEFRKLIDTLELNEEQINPENLNLLNYFIKYIDFETGRTDRGVLFVNSLNSAFVDRPVIIYIGLDESWCKINSDKQYIDKINEEQKNLEKFQILLSQGDFKYYFTLNLKNNSEVKPSYYFSMLEDKEISDFDDTFFNPVKVTYSRPERKKHIKEKIKINQPPEELKSISPSSLNQYMICPKKYSYNTMLLSEDQSYFLKGNLLHNFAEFYFHHPECAKDNFVFILDKLLENYKVFVKGGNSESEKTAFLIGMKSIMTFIDSGNFKKIKAEIIREKTKEKAKSTKNNFLFDLLKKDKKYSNTELWFENFDAGIRGKIDLISDNTIVDFKTSKKKKTEQELIKEFKPEIMKEYEYRNINFQTVAYLAGKREDLKDEIIEFIYFHLLSDLKDKIKGIEDTNPVSLIKYIPVTFKEYIISEKYFDEVKNKFLSRIGYENYKTVIESKYEFIDFFDKYSIRSELAKVFFDFGIINVGITLEEFGRRKESSFTKEEIIPFLNKIHNTRIGSGGAGLVFKDDIDNFVDFVKEKLEEINKYKKSDFPNLPVYNLRTVCRECDFLNICIGNKLWSADEGEDENY